LFGTNNNIEGNHLSEKFVDDNSRIKKINGENRYYWMRSTYATLAFSAKLVNDNGNFANNYANDSNIGCAPLVVLI
jgi:hypothetical protein